MVEDIVDQVQQMTTTAHHGLCAAPFLRITEVRIKQGFTVTNDRRQRCAYLMAHIRQELTLGLGRVSGQLLFEPLLLALPLDSLPVVTLRSINAGAFQVCWIAVAVINRMERDGGPALVAIPGQVSGFYALDCPPGLQLFDHQPPEAVIGDAGFQHVRIPFEQFAAAVVAQQARHGRIGSNKSPVRRHLEDPLDCIVEQRLIALKIRQRPLAPAQRLALNLFDPVGQGKREQNNLCGQTKLGRVGSEGVQRQDTHHRQGVDTEAHQGQCPGKEVGTGRRVVITPGQVTDHNQDQAQQHGANHNPFHGHVVGQEQG